MDGFYKPCTRERNKNGGGIIIFTHDTISVKFQKQVFLKIMLRIFLQNLILENVNGYFEEYTIPHLRAMNIFSITLIRPFILIMSVIKFCLGEILRQKYWNNAYIFFFICMNFENQQNRKPVSKICKNQVAQILY